MKGPNTWAGLKGPLSVCLEMFICLHLSISVVPSTAVTYTRRDVLTATVAAGTAPTKALAPTTALRTGRGRGTSHGAPDAATLLIVILAVGVTTHTTVAVHHTAATDDSRATTIR